MRNSARPVYASILMFAGLVANFQTGDIIEFRQALNAHRDSDVRAGAGNVSFTVAPQTQGAVRSYKKFRNGKYALELEIRSGPFAGRRAWFFYNSEKPSMKLYAASAPRPDAVVSKPEQARSATTVAPARATAEAKEEGLDRLLASVMKASDGPELEEGGCASSPTPETAREAAPTEIPIAVLSEGAKESAPAQPEAAKPSGEIAGYPESQASAPTRDEHSGVSPSDNPCRWQTHGEYEVCLEKQTGIARSFIFANHEGEAGERPHRREWEFLRPESARQELEFRITDKADIETSLHQESYFRVFPRKVLPAIRQEGDRLIVTIPTGETVSFDARTKKVIDGVLAEKDLVHGKSAAVNYTGGGVVLRADRRGDDPRTNSTVAVISKPQCKAGERCQPCKVPVKKLWTENEDNPLFRFPTDAQFDEFVKKTCGFSIY